MGGKGVISGEGADGLPSPSEGNGSHQRPGDIREGSSLEDHGAEADAYDVQLVVRWIFEGTPRHLLIADDSPPRSVYEGVFVYSFDQHGLVKEHRLEAINPAPPFVASWKAMFGGGMPAAPGATSLPGASAPAATLKAMGNAREVHG
ncbi:uncharacterized protein EV422DRAFT_517603 [Fimicolochytrium jonesii]|uniref:uncharacterized protein n=1 Tax=Fimicolochytrium jonesii TaxID=1396493 RepID=UPI0022FDFC7B|nr:uncharacterized protein EV422DRAFT_517603 [Fimicolochytrium jonesii]KAI8825145.1 hypothetical protein EV422DRAFT_517603 [Fimicolochytrium jonesii]